MQCSIRLPESHLLSGSLISFIHMDMQNKRLPLAEKACRMQA
ncbi:hypothetical protein HMPREF9371_1535 [Neisseria shayeganii 871]|uniref:Uncharacterized protein n=1 Tax=Neisseria shayeganii 871 TaxID=1032488 RepID=G4CIU6_9NEIS|nr:hypothetical protein HMPREF9371_1535 [Neisseria shayeganii 871]